MRQSGGFLSFLSMAVIGIAVVFGFSLVGGFSPPKHQSSEIPGETFTPINDTGTGIGDNKTLQLNKILFKENIKNCPGTSAVNFVLDRSGTMAQKQDGGTKVKIEYLKDGVKGFLSMMSDESIIGIQSFGGQKGTLDFPIDKLKDQRDAINTKINSFRGTGTTPMKDALVIAKGELTRAKELYKDYSFSLVLLSDGKWNVGGDPTQVVSDIKSMGVRVFTIAYGDKTIVNFMKQAASLESDSYYSPGNAEIEKILNEIQKKICD